MLIVTDNEELKPWIPIFCDWKIELSYTLQFINSSIAFGTQPEIMKDKMKDIAFALNISGLTFPQKE